MIEPENVNAAAKKLEDENYKFRRYLKNHADYDELDNQFLELHNELFAGYDCCRCNNCCRAYSTAVQEYEVDPIAAFLGLPKQAFIEKYLARSADEYEYEYEIKAPCCFLNADGACAIEACKPEVCRDFPHTDKPDRLGSLLGVVSFAEECPVVFEILQRLKKIYRFQSRR